jgi:hypothetical protein
MSRGLFRLVGVRSGSWVVRDASRKAGHGDNLIVASFIDVCFKEISVSAP